MQLDRKPLVHERGIEPHIPVCEKSQRTDGAFSRDDFTYDHGTDTYRCPAGKTLQHYRRRFAMPRIGIMKDNSNALQGQQARLPGVPAQAALLPEGAGAQDFAVNLRRGARPGP
jgi:hypothetical protein